MSSIQVNLDNANLVVEAFFSGLLRDITNIYDLKAYIRKNNLKFTDSSFDNNTYEIIKEWIISDNKLVLKKIDDKEFMNKYVYEYLYHYVDITRLLDYLDESMLLDYFRSKKTNKHVILAYKHNTNIFYTHINELLTSICIDLTIRDLFFLLFDTYEKKVLWYNLVTPFFFESALEELRDHYDISSFSYIKYGVEKNYKLDVMKLFVSKNSLIDPTDETEYIKLYQTNMKFKAAILYIYFDYMPASVYYKYINEYGFLQITSIFHNIPKLANEYLEQIFKEFNININESNYKYSYLEYAIQYGRFNVADLFVKLGAKLFDEKDNALIKYLKPKYAISYTQHKQCVSDWINEIRHNREIELFKNEYMHMDYFGQKQLKLYIMKQLAKKHLDEVSKMIL